LSIDPNFAHDATAAVIDHVRAGRFQQSLSFITGASAIASALEVSQEHYTGSFGQHVMVTPLICCALLAIVGFAGAADPYIARACLPWVSGLLILDGVVGFAFHIRGIARKPGGWSRNLVFNIVMGPPIFAPLVLSMSGLLGLVASRLLPETAMEQLSPQQFDTLRYWLAASTAVYAALNGFEALYSHYKSRFDNPAQWTPIVLSPLLLLSALAFLFWPDRSRFVFEITCAAGFLAGCIGMGFHLYGIFRRPGGTRHLIYNIIYGPPLFAPLLFAATGFLGLLATQIGLPP
jgi:hypothetical protein